MRYAFLFLWFILCSFKCDTCFILTEEDKNNWAFYQKVYEKNITPVPHSPSIPKILHFIWLGNKEFPETSLKNLQVWKKLHPAWKVLFWTDRDNITMLPGIESRRVREFQFQELGEFYHLSDNYGERADILRYEILLQQGGLYADHDTQPVRAFDALQDNYDFYCGLEELGPTILSTSVFPSTHIIAARPGHPVIQNAVTWLKNNWERIGNYFPGNEPTSILNRVKHRTFFALEEGIKLGVNEPTSRNIVFPPRYFSTTDKKNAVYARHFHAGSWYQPYKELEAKIKKHLEKIETQERQEMLILFSICALNVLVLYLFSRRFKRKSALFSLLLLFALSSCEKKETASEFEQFMGKKSEHWKYITQTRDKGTLDRYEQLYEKNKQYLKSALSLAKIPHVVHFIWLGPKPFPPGSVENIRTWIAQNPGWKVKYWTDWDRPPPCAGMERHLVQDFQFDFLGSCYEESQNWGEKSDILRFEILYKEGGVYADHDANCLVPFEKLHNGYDFYCGLEAPHPAFVGRNVTSGNGVLGSRPGHPVVKKVIELIGTRWEELGQKYRSRDSATKVELVMQRTYIALTDALVDTVDKEGNTDIVLPSAYFFAKTGIASLYSKHFYATAWADSVEKDSFLEKNLSRCFRKLQQKARKINVITLLIFVFNLSFIILYLLSRKSRSPSSS